MRTLVRSAIVVLALWSAAPAAAGDTRGMLWMNPAAARRATAATAAGFPMPADGVRAQRGVTEAVVWIEQLPDKVEHKLAVEPHRWFWQKKAPPPRLASVVQRGTAFAPRVVAVPVGARVAFRNLDNVYHNVFSVSAARRFDLGKYPPGRADTVEFKHAGVANLHCDIHPSELGYVVVVPNHAFARPDSTGAFHLPKLPPGSYKVHAWHPSLGELVKKFDVPRHGDVGLQLAF